MEKTIKPMQESDLPVVEHEGNLESKLPVIRSKHASKHMSFNTGDYRTREVMEREDGVGYNPKTGTFYQTDNFRK
jgi:hypothetical protein